MIFWAGQLPQLFPLRVARCLAASQMLSAEVMTAACGYSFPCPAPATTLPLVTVTGGSRGPAWCCVLLPLDRQTGADNGGGPCPGLAFFPLCKVLGEIFHFDVCVGPVIQLPWFIGHLAARDATHVTLYQTLPTQGEISEISTTHNTGGPWPSSGVALDCG